MGAFFRRLFILSFAFVVCGALGSGAFYFWAAGRVVDHRSYNRRSRQWVESWTYDDMKHYLYVAFLISGALGAAGTFRLILKSDSDQTDLSD